MSVLLNKILIDVIEMIVSRSDYEVYKQVKSFIFKLDNHQIKSRILDSFACIFDDYSMIKYVRFGSRGLQSCHRSFDKPSIIDYKYSDILFSFDGKWYRSNGLPYRISNTRRYYGSCDTFSKTFTNDLTITMCYYTIEASEDIYVFRDKSIYRNGLRISFYKNTCSSIFDYI